MMLETVYSSVKTLINSVSNWSLPNTLRLSPFEWFGLLLSFQYVVKSWLYLHSFRRTSARDSLGSMFKVLLIEDHISPYIDP